MTSLERQGHGLGAQVAAEVGVPLADVRDAMLRREDWRTLLTDGLHLTAGGCEVVLGALLATVEGELPRECHADGMPMHMEDWRVHAGVDQ